MVPAPEHRDDIKRHVTGHWSLSTVTVGNRALAMCMSTFISGGAVSGGDIVQQMVTRNRGLTLARRHWPAVRRASKRSGGYAVEEVVMDMSIPDIALRMVAGLCVPEKPIVLAQTETCWPVMGAGADVSADAAPADSRTVPAARVVVRRMRTGFMIDAFRGGECAWSIRRTDVGGFFPAGILWRLPL